MADAVKPTETNEAKFVRLANARLAKALAAIAALRGLTNKKAYGYTDEQVKLIVQIMADEVTKVATAFANPTTGKATPTFIK